MTRTLLPHSRVGRRLVRHPRVGAAAAGVALATLGTLLLGPAADSAPALPTPSTARAADDGATLASVEQVDERTLDLEIDSPAVGERVPVRLLLPSNFQAEPDRTWPLLYLLHGAHDDQTSWTRETNVEEFTADKDVLTVLPSAGPTGIPTDWRQHLGSAPDYETFQVEELGQLLQRNYRAGEKRAVAGVSTGGYGALAFAARHPDTFGAAASYSGITHLTYPGVPRLVQSIVARELTNPWSLWGDPILSHKEWQARDPYVLAEQLKDSHLYISQGSGIPDDGDQLDGGPLEAALWPSAASFRHRLAALDVPAETHYYARGVHGWSYWQREFTASWPVLAKGLGLSE